MLFNFNFGVILLLSRTASVVVNAAPTAQRHDPNKENIDPNVGVDWLGIAQGVHAGGGQLGGDWNN